MTTKIIPKVDHLEALVYVSTATHQYCLAEIEHLLNRAQARNAAADVTGVLLYNDGSILQYLEGPASELTRIFEIIKADPRHFGIIELYRGPIPAREFAEWTMAFRSADTLILSQPIQYVDLLSQRLDPFDAPMTKARMLVTKLWNKGRPRYCY
jgi:hypothetical protein